jgi:hypothetical protein
MVLLEVEAQEMVFEGGVGVRRENNDFFRRILSVSCELKWTNNQNLGARLNPFERLINYV